jgi:hypothetical protein
MAYATELPSISSAESYIKIVKDKSVIYTHIEPKKEGEE